MHEFLWLIALAVCHGSARQYDNLYRQDTAWTGNNFTTSAGLDWHVIDSSDELIGLNLDCIVLDYIKKFLDAFQ